MGQDQPTVSQVEDARARLMAGFPRCADRLVPLVDEAAAGDGGALAGLLLAAEELADRATLAQWPSLARHASALATLARVEQVRHFDVGAAIACLAALRTSFGEARKPRTTDAAPQPGSARPLIQVADEDEEQRYLLARLLERFGFDVLQAADAAQALDVARRRQPAATLLAVPMASARDGSIVRQFKADPRTVDVPVMLLKASAGEGERPVPARPSAEADDCVTLPLRPQELLVHLNRLLK